MGADGGYHIDDMAELRQFHGWMNTIDDAYREVNTYVRTEVCNDSGLTGVLSPLKGALELAQDGFSYLTFRTIDMWEDTEEAFFLTARTYAESEGQAVKYFSKSDREVEREIQRQINERRQEKMERDMEGQGIY